MRARTEKLSLVDHANGTMPTDLVNDTCIYIPSCIVNEPLQYFFIAFQQRLYVTQFFSDRNSHLPGLMNLKIRYSTLADVTNKFTNDETRLNCAKIKSLYACDLTVHSENFDSYFPSLCDFY